jgi:hypothetical protein
MAKEKKNRNWLKIAYKRLNPAGEENKKIREKNKVIKSDTSTTQEKQVAKAQKIFFKRKRGDQTVEQVREKQKSKMKSKLQRKTADFKKYKKGDMSKAEFIRKYPNSQTAKTAKKSGWKPKKKKDFYTGTYL